MPLSVNCPSCQDHLDVEEQYRTWKVRCPSCGTEFVPEDLLGRSARGIRRADEDDEDEDDFDRPRRRRRRRLTNDEVEDRARDLIAGPASALRVWGIMLCLFAVLGIILAVLIGSLAVNNPAFFNNGNNPNNAKNDPDELLFNCIIIGIASVIGLVLGVLTVIGANRMANLKSHSWAMASAILAISSIIACSCALFVGMPIGIWALVTIANPKVRAGFDVVARRENRYSVDDD